MNNKITPLIDKECNDFGYIQRPDNIYKDYFHKEDVNMAISGLIKDCKKFKYWEHCEGLFDCIKKHFGDFESLSSFDTKEIQEEKNEDS